MTIVAAGTVLTGGGIRMRRLHQRPGTILTAVIILFLTLGLGAVSVSADSQAFPETGHTVSGAFLDYWRANGGLTTFGLPITDAANETNAEDGKTYLTQWFERNRLELHPEIGGGTILLGLLGKDLRREALAVDPDFQRADVLVNAAQPKEEQVYFQKTGHNLRFSFLDYWNANGGLARFGFPISEEHKEIDPETGNVYVMQWFERARFEFHTESSQVQLGLLGKQIKAPKPGSVEFVWKIGRQGFNTLKNPQGVAVDAQGNVYVADTDNHRIQKYDNTGRFLSRWGSPGNGDGQLKSPHALIVDSQGSIFVADTDNFRIQKFDASGRFLLKWGSKGAGDGQLDSLIEGPQGIATDGSGNIYVCDAGGNRVQKFDGNGR
ncbi:MAG: hypothetical protein LC748_10590, partial [Thermomicrobia bacterium]|nr:hypothetical protein [Thermomicrobia bacterium]